MIIETTAPIAIEDLKKYFEDKSTSFMIDYSRSELQGEKLLVYLSNLDIPCDIKNYDEGLIESYLKATVITNIPSLEQHVIALLFSLKLDEDVPFKENLKLWEKKIDSLSLYNMHTINVPEVKEWVAQFPKDDTNDLEGINFVSLLKHEETYGLFEFVKQENLTFYSKYFNDYMFKGQNLYSYWAHENNPMFLLTWGVATGEVAELRQAG